MSSSPDIFFVDDEPDDLLGPAEELGLRDRFCDFTPADIKDKQEQAKAGAQHANLWIFDFFNDDAQRVAPDLSSGGVAANGLSVFQQFRLVIGNARPPAMVVSNHLETALGQAVNANRRHVLAEQLGVEWLAQKTDPAVLPEAIALADGYKTLMNLAGHLRDVEWENYARVFAETALKVPNDASWATSAVRDVNHHRPPQWVADSNERAAREVIGWLIRQIIPYPSFLINDRHVSARLGIELACLREALLEKTRLAEELTKVAYSGALAEFAGPRWWSAGIDSIGLKLPRSKPEREAALKELVVPVSLRMLKFSDPVVTSDADLVETDNIADAAECVRAADEHFPPEAPEAWVLITAVKNDKALARKVRLEDQAEILGEQ